MLKGIISAVFLAVACTFLYGQQPSITTFLKEGELEYSNNTKD